jgi:signal transduction histidine kinase/DNA-binding NarL/FixJ family response regulator
MCARKPGSRNSILAIALAAALLPSCSPPREPSPRAVDGTIDLAGIGFSGIVGVALSGSWKFKWMESRPEFADPGYDDSSWELFEVPGFWTSLKGTGSGYGWFRLRVRNLSAEGRQLAILRRSAQTAERIFVDGREVMNAGDPGTSRKSTRPAVFPYLVPVSASGEALIAVMVSNFNYRDGGMQHSPVIGDYARLSRKLWFDDMAGILIVGAILMMALYNLIAWLFMREETAILHFALFCLSMCLYSVFRFGFIQRALAEADAYEALQRSEMAAGFLCMILFAHFIRRLFPRDHLRRGFSVYLPVLAGAAIFGAAAPTWFTTSFAPGFLVVMAAGAAWLVWSVIRAVARGAAYAKTVLAGIALLLGSMVIETLSAVIPSAVSGHVLEFGTLAVIVLYSAILSSRFAAALRTSRHLSERLGAEVESQTRTIREQNGSLARLVQEKTDLFVNFNHETKTPLALISSYLDRAMAKRGGDRDLAIVRSNLDKLIRDMTNSLDLEKLLRGQSFYHHERAVPLSEATEEKVDLFSEMARLKGVDLRRRIAKGIFARIDPYALDRVLNNLLDNALRYTPSGGRIDVVLELREEEAALAVEDSGVGIPADRLATIFEPYYQISRGKGNRQGMGLGLSIVERIMESAGGRIRVRSEEGKGSRFEIRLPSCPPPLPGQEASTDPGPSRPMALPPRAAPPPEGLPGEAAPADMAPVLVVEDNLDMLAYLVQELAAEFDVYAAASGREALTRLESIPRPRLILSDVMMDGMDGFGLLEALSRSEAYRSIPLVFLTARAREDERVEGLRRGAVDVIPKPFSSAELLGKLRSLVKSLDAQRETLVKDVQASVAALLPGSKSAAAGESLQEERFRGFKVTPREREIALALMRGLQYKEIASDLGISVGTLKSYVAALYRKCGVQNKVELLNLLRGR